MEIAERGEGDKTNQSEWNGEKKENKGGMWKDAKLEAKNHPGKYRRSIIDRWEMMRP